MKAERVDYVIFGQLFKSPELHNLLIFQMLTIGNIISSEICINILYNSRLLENIFSRFFLILVS